MRGDFSHQYLRPRMLSEVTPSIDMRLLIVAGVLAFFMGAARQVRRRRPQGSWLQIFACALISCASGLSLYLAGTWYWGPTAGVPMAAVSSVAGWAGIELMPWASEQLMIIFNALSRRHAPKPPTEDQ